MLVKFDLGGDDILDMVKFIYNTQNQLEEERMSSVNERGDTINEQIPVKAEKAEEPSNLP